ncbi:MAG: hypothetical protein ACI4RG_03845 [Huintestinicola sp.]
MHDTLISLKIKTSILDINSEKAKELIDKSNRYDDTVLLGDDVPRLTSHMDKLYFFSDSTDNVIEQWDNFQHEYDCANEFIHSEYGSVKCCDKISRYIYLEHTSGGNSILYNELNRMIKQHRLTELALSGARENVQSYIRENPQQAESEGFVLPEDMYYSVHSCRYGISDPTEPVEYKDEWIAVEIEMRNSHRLIGYYTMIFDSGNGIITDDIFYSL